jgi:molybdopterin-guanine dinucleotide biosynthesis protein A
MGVDKGLVNFLGQPLVQRALTRLGHIADEILLTTNHPESYAFLDLPLIPDRIPGRGALGGLYTALSAARHPLVAVVACDMPFASPKLFEHLAQILAAPEIDAAIPRTSGGTEPFHAVYRRRSCLPAVAGVIRADRWRVDSWFSDENIHFFEGEDLALFDRNGLVFRNVNTPEELRQAEEIAKDRSL